MTGKRRFGRVRRLPSGRWQARYKGPDEIDRPAPRAFRSKADAARWLALTEAEIIRGDWLNPDTGRVSFADYAQAWVAERPNLSPKTTQLYEGLVRIHLSPVLGALLVPDITEAHPPQPPGTTTAPRMSVPPPNITMNRNRAGPFYTGFRTPTCATAAEQLHPGMAEGDHLGRPGRHSLP
jgi:hypothetical protein